MFLSRKYKSDADCCISLSKNYPNNSFFLHHFAGNKSSTRMGGIYDI